MKAHKIYFQTHGDNQGTLVAIEGCKDIPFPIKRVYYMYGTGEHVIRGRHAHKALQQVLICVHGSCRIRIDDGEEQETVLLDQPDTGLYIPNAIWREMFDFSSDAVLMVLASEPYCESDYIRGYEDFLCFINNHEDTQDDAP